jgi:hypothetical protein
MSYAVKCKRDMIATSGKVAKAPHLANRLTDRQKQDAWKLLRIYYSFIANKIVESDVLYH